jgi:hypothetical protein
MSFTYTEVVAWTNNPTYQGQVKVAIQKSAQFMVEGNGGIAMNVNQLTNATRALRDSNLFVSWFIFAVAMDATVQSDGSTPTDAHIQAVIDAKRMEVWS